MSYNKLKELNSMINNLDRELTEKEIAYHKAMQAGNNLLITSLDFQIKKTKAALKELVELLANTERDSLQESGHG